MVYPHATSFDCTAGHHYLPYSVIHDYHEWNGDRKDTAPEIDIYSGEDDWKIQHWYFGEYINDSLGNGERIATLNLKYVVFMFLGMLILNRMHSGFG
jgi:hypothetical protein